MNELEISMRLGILPDPEKNRVISTQMTAIEVSYLSQIFDILNHQKKTYGSFNPNLWVELLPWHSMN